MAYIWGKSNRDKKGMPIFKEIAEDIKKAAADVSVKIRWGADWDGDGISHERVVGLTPHFEVVG